MSDRKFFVPVSAQRRVPGPHLRAALARTSALTAVQFQIKELSRSLAIWSTFDQTGHVDAAIESSEVFISGLRESLDRLEAEIAYWRSEGGGEQRGQG